MPAPQLLLNLLRLHHRLPAGRVATELDVSRATLMRLVRSAGDAVLTIGRARRTSYALRRSLRGDVHALPLYRIDRDARAEQVAELDLAYPDGCLLSNPEAFGWPLDLGMRDGWFDGIPYPLQGMRPEGFLGRAFARAWAGLLQLPEDPRVWTDDDVLQALTLLGSDTPGDHIIGETAYRAWTDRLAEPLEAIVDDDVTSQYRVLADRAMGQGVAGSSAGGEFPKFTAVRESGSGPEHVLVKFSGSDGAAGTRRWSDLLVCEQIASECVGHLAGLVGARSRIVQTGHRTFLEVLRFDRNGAHGRSPVCSWAAIDGTWFGLGGRPWTLGARHLRERRLIDAETDIAIARLWFFGQLIANTDMHDGNLSFVPDGQAFRLAPVYDMLPMLYAPLRGVELPTREFRPRLPLPSERSAWHEAADAAIGFWRRSAADARIGSEFRQICARNALLVEAAAALPAAGAPAPNP